MIDNNSLLLMLSQLCTEFEQRDKWLVIGQNTTSKYELRCDRKLVCTVLHYHLMIMSERDEISFILLNNRKMRNNTEKCDQDEEVKVESP
uniref:Uncharacterized protein n=1 Tax=Onchocerca volvulus TaxID=6282 RepID=A0A8R1TTN3_ONCVO